MDKDFDIKFKALPSHVQGWMADESTDLNDQVATKHGLDLSQTGRMVDVISKTILGTISLEGFLGSLKEVLPEIDEMILKNIAIDIFAIRFWPIRDYLVDTEEILGELGGQIPEDVAFYKDKHVGEADIKEDAQSIPGSVTNVGFGSVLEQYPGISGQFITSKPIILKEGAEPVNAILSNWLEDYKLKKGNPPHSGAEREEYLASTNNASGLDNSERTILRGLLKAYDAGGELPIDPTTKKLVLSELFQRGSLVIPGAVASPSAPQATPQTQSGDLPNNIVDLRK